MEKYDFAGYATRINVRCTDGRVIGKDAFKHNDGAVVPLVWNHDHSNPFNVLGHATLEHREDGVYAYGKFNNTESGKAAKLVVENGDVVALSIWANGLKQRGPEVVHGSIKEVSLVLAGANPEAFIENIIRHGEEFEDEALLYTATEDDSIELFHADEETEEDETGEDILKSFTEKQRNFFYAMIGKALEHSEQNEEAEEIKHSEQAEAPEQIEVSEQVEEPEQTKETEQVEEPEQTEESEQVEEPEPAKENVEESEGGNETMKENAFAKDKKQESFLSHSDMETIIKDAKRCGSLKESFETFLAHADESTATEYAEKTQTYGINGTDWLFPEARNLNNVPEFIKRDTGWVAKVMHGVHHTPFSRIKSMFADITEDDARAKGYIKGKLKKEEVFGLLKRTTVPATIYKKQKLDRDDVVDITDFDVIAWIKSEMRMMLDEEIARAVLIGDGRSTSSDDKINEMNIRPIWTDEDLFTIKTLIEGSASDSADKRAKAFIRAVVKSRKNYKGSGEPTLYTTEDMLTDCLLLEDNNGRVIYDTIEKLKNALRVKDIVTVPVMEGRTRDDGEGHDLELMGLVVNLADYNIGADKGGAVNMFDDFDIDYNAMKYLIETRCSGALIKPFSAIAVEYKTV